MKFASMTFLTVSAVVLIQCGAGLVPAADADERVTIRKWKVDPVELHARPKGPVTKRWPASKLEVKEAERVEKSFGWLKINVDGKDYYVEESQVQLRTALKLNEPQTREPFIGTPSAAGRGYGP